MQGFSRTFGLEFEPSQPTAGEMERARELVYEKYASDRWTQKI
jgi:lipoate-protein ligase A